MADPILDHAHSILTAAQREEWLTVKEFAA